MFIFHSPHSLYLVLLWSYKSFIIIILFQYPPHFSIWSMPQWRDNIGLSGCCIISVGSQILANLFFFFFVSPCKAIIAFSSLSILAHWACKVFDSKHNLHPLFSVHKNVADLSDQKCHVGSMLWMQTCWCVRVGATLTQTSLPSSPHRWSWKQTLVYGTLWADYSLGDILGRH